MTPKTFLLAVVLAAPLAASSQEAAKPSPAPDLGAPTPAVAPAPNAATPDAAVGAPAPAKKKPEHGIFPLWGDKVRAKGFNLPEPFGFMVNYYHQRSDIEITNLQLGFNGGPMYDASGLIQVPKATTQASALAIRPNIMILPFFSVYALFSSGATETSVHVTSPLSPDLAFDTLAKSGAQVLALGGTLQFGYKGFFGVADFNAAVSDVERLADAVGSNMLSFRLGYNFGTPGGKGLALWAGTAGQVLDVATKGSVKLGDVLPPPSQATVDEARARCDAIPVTDPGRRAVCNAFADQLQEWNDTGYGGTVEYSLDKKPAGVWNMVLGAQYALDKNWQFRFETSFLNGRTTFLAATEYRFDIL